MTTPLLSIICNTYNHEDFISQAIDSFLMQKTDFPIEIIIHDDCSTDYTQKIIQDYADKNPGLIKTIFQKENQHSQGIKPRKFTLPHCQGKYIALCEGDDYWTDSNKLQKQVDFLEKNTDYSICFHNAKVLKNGILVDNFLKTIVTETTTILDLAKDNYIYTASAVLRNYFSQGLPEYFNSSPAGDYLLWMVAAEKGKIKYFDEVMSVYRIHVGGIWAPKSLIEKLEASAKVKKILMDNFDGEVKDVLRLSYINQLNRIISEYKKIERKSLNDISGVQDPYYIRENTTLNVILRALLAKIRLDYLRVKWK